jgi:glycosyltransferase involved in cell wall biosynthesis
VKLTTWHIITSEYPPQFGGVSDYTRLVAEELARAGDEVHVWCSSRSTPAIKGDDTGADIRTLRADHAGVIVHRELGDFTPADLRRASGLLEEFSEPRRLLVQWVPHGYGYRSMNLAFCLWLGKRAARHRDEVELMVHEPYLAFGEGSWKQNGVAAVHRLMTAALMKAATRVWISIPAWEDRLRPYAFGRPLEFSWLPVASNIPVVDDPAGVRAVRDSYAANGERLVGHFGTYDRNTTELLLRAAPLLLQDNPACKLLLLGRGGEQVRAKLIAAQPDLRIGSQPGLAERVHATGTMSANNISLHLSACQLLLQPFIDGVSSRRTAVMAGLAHGIPIVTTSGRLTEPLWAESKAVALAPGADAAALVKETSELLSDETSRRRLSAAGKELYDQRFAIERTVVALRGLRTQDSGIGTQISTADS